VLSTGPQLAALQSCSIIASALEKIASSKRSFQKRHNPHILRLMVRGRFEHVGALFWRMMAVVTFSAPAVARHRQRKKTRIARNRESFDLVFLRSAISLVA
jgi:hypothetical protein